MSYLTDREIHVVGIQRTGQHAVTSWIIGHFNSVCYKNCMSQLNQRKGHCASIQPPFWLFEPKKQENWTESNFIPMNQDAIVLGTEFTIYDVGLNNSISMKKKDICLANGVENFSKRVDHVLVIRNPYNQFSSILNWGRNRVLSKPKNFLNMWEKMAYECLGKTSNFPHATVICYDDWFSNINNRIEVEKELDLIRDDSRINIVMKIGHGRSWGSSFDGMESNNKAQSMDVLNRWKLVKEDHRFKEVANNKKIRDLAEEFGWSCPL